MQAPDDAFIFQHMTEDDGKHRWGWVQCGLSLMGDVRKQVVTYCQMKLLLRLTGRRARVWGRRTAAELRIKPSMASRHGGSLQAGRHGRAVILAFHTGRPISQPDSGK